MFIERSSDKAESSDDSDDFSVHDLTSAARSKETSDNMSEVKPSAVETRHTTIEGSASDANEMSFSQSSAFQLSTKTKSTGF